MVASFASQQVRPHGGVHGRECELRHMLLWTCACRVHDTGIGAMHRLILRLHQPYSLHEEHGIH